MAMEIKVKKLTRTEIDQAMPLVLEVFNEYEAVHYPENGKEAFRQAVCSKDYLDMLTAYGAFNGDTLTGIIATRNNGSHIALFFVRGDYHRQGIGKMLFEECIRDHKNTEITVNSSEYAVEVYKKLGFVQVDSLKDEDGIRFIPMLYQR
ncbi:MAG: GNAT family N-acetyltransferase [Lachnospiraceae bacterium]|nr:GNAT family N-acetyltransferase [Lachnospiraceae bacterium]